MFMKHAKAQYSTKSTLAAAWRSARGLIYYRHHIKLLNVPVVWQYVRKVAQHDLFYHLSHRNYLANFLTLNERVDFAMSHMRIESQEFNNSYKEAVYLNGGLVVWEQESKGMCFQIQLKMAARLCQEGDLELVMSVDGERLYSYKFSWMDGVKINKPGTIVPWITTCQGIARDKVETAAKFSTAFPNNWPKMFCLAALQGVAAAIKSDVIVGLPGLAQVALKAGHGEQFFSSYDNFWLSLNGTLTSRYGYIVPVDFPEKDLTEISAKHRNRARKRRQHWAEIEQSVLNTLRQHRSVKEESGANHGASGNESEAAHIGAGHPQFLHTASVPASSH